ncbi:Beta-barrel assembly-enhancing protease [Defluviimonas aquaemixtae]|uniref:Beta-barrel assembly-enhancing protease n=1 Tax=Albidovulum aquaemixtae TaxID=1542388 RepID=A0A2R8BMK1_9RHOB|nr:M48 family metallopeptidase [Defluviimonas aquaemixtae]SPH24641.1 Beta-barrel assembly-enhancing protease [Defluviimonas aquaemixtae]
MRKLIVLIALGLAGCVESVPQQAVPVEPLPVSGAPVMPLVAAQNFVSVVSRMEPVIERECLARIGPANCNFRIVVDERPGQPPNAYQTLDRAGRPIIAFTLPLIAEARNTDELAFVMGHEAGHHIGEHIPRQQQSALAGALILGTLTAATGGDPAAIQSAQDVGGALGARRYAKEYELEADALGTIMAWRAGYDPERGAAFFTRIPDPGNRFLGTHPPTASRIETVRRTLASLR